MNIAYYILCTRFVRTRFRSEHNVFYGRAGGRVSTLGLTAGRSGGPEAEESVRFDWERTWVVYAYTILSGGDAGERPCVGARVCVYIYIICVTANFPSGPARYHPRDKPRGKLGIRLECVALLLSVCVCVRARYIIRHGNFETVPRPITRYCLSKTETISQNKNKKQ